MAHVSLCTTTDRPDRSLNLLTIGLAALRQIRSLAALPTLWHRRHLERCHLRSLEDHVLADMGLTRAEVEREAQKPFWRTVSPRRAPERSGVPGRSPMLQRSSS